MSKLYTGFSNYQEMNLNNRIQSIVNEIKKWGKNSNKFKIYRNEWKKAAEENYLPKFPLHVDIELSDACNLKCKMCHFSEKDMSTIKKRRKMLSTLGHQELRSD